MASASISVRLDAKDKKDFEDFCNDTGLNISVAFNMFVKNVLKEHKLPFEVSTDPFYSKKNIKYLKKTINDYESGKSKLIEHDLIDE